MKLMHGGTILALLLSAGGALAAGVECGPEGGRIVDSQAAVVWIAMDEETLAVTDDPEALEAMQAGGAAPVMTPDDFCMQGWVLPAPHPGDPVPAPAPVPVVGGRVGQTRPATIQPRPLPIDVGGTASASAAAQSVQSETEAAAVPSEDSSLAGPDVPVVVVTASDEPTPTPAGPAPAMEARRAPSDGCSSTGTAGSALWSLLLLAGLRRRRGGR